MGTAIPEDVVTSETGQTVVYSATVLVITAVDSAGQSVTSAAQEVTGILEVVDTVSVVMGANELTVVDGAKDEVLSGA